MRSDREDSVAELVRIARTFGGEAEAAKVRLLERIGRDERVAARRLPPLHDALCFVMAYPDSARVRQAAERLADGMRARVERLVARGGAGSLDDSGVPGCVHRHSYSLPVLRQLLEQFPGCLDIDWDEFEDEAALHNALVMLVTNNECQGLDDIDLPMADWVAAVRAPSDGTDLETIVGLFERCDWPLELKTYVFEQCALPVRFRLACVGSGRCEMRRPVARLVYQRDAIARERRALIPDIRRPIGTVALASRKVGRELVRTALAALSARNLEIASLIYANPDDVTVVEAAGGLAVALIGVVPEYRDALESTFFFLILKNGIPLAYGPASVCLGCCEMGINLFPEFRGAEIRTIYAQFMRSLFHVLGVRYFYLTSYGMGVGNPEAIRTGAFWFYRKLGFVADSSEVEDLARIEERRMTANPGYRCDRKTLRRLARTSASFDMSDGGCRRLRLGALGLQQSRYVARRFDGDRAAALAGSRRRLQRLLAIRSLDGWSDSETRALDLYAPLLCMIEGIDGWSAAERRALVRIIRSKGARSERDVDRLVCAHARLLAALRSISDLEPEAG